MAAYLFRYGFNEQLLDIYNGILEDGRDKLPYRMLTPEEFRSIFLVERRITIWASLEGVPVAFISASLPDENKKAYLSYIGVLPKHRKRGLGSALLRRLEQELFRTKTKAIETVFYDSVSLPWLIPGTTDGHPCAPGVPSGSSGEKLLLRNGYSEWCAQIAYYTPVNHYVIPRPIVNLESQLWDRGIEIIKYNPLLHNGLDTIFDRIGNPGWKKGVMANVHLPILVASDMNRDNYVIGYTGPLTQVREGDGIRGNFCGIGTDPAYRNLGIGKCLFARMCYEQSRYGATFMSLYTGETMSARKVYEAAGCRPVARFSNLRKINPDPEY